jgi:hypothetical protein
MKTKVICLKIDKVPESNKPDARIYFDAFFKRVGKTKKADAETERVMTEHPTVRLNFGTWDGTPFVVGQEYALDITPYVVKEKTNG